MKALDQYSFLIYDSEGDSQIIRPNLETRIRYGNSAGGDLGEPECASFTLFQEYFEFEVKNLNHKLKEPVKHVFDECEHRTSQLRSYLPKILLEDIRTQVENEMSHLNFEDPASVIERDGLPDLLVVRSVDECDYCFVEVKQPGEPFRSTQLEWIDKFGFFDIKVVFVFIDREDIEEVREKFDIRDEINI